MRNLCLLLAFNVQSQHQFLDMCMIKVTNPNSYKGQPHKGTTLWTHHS